MQFRRYGIYYTPRPGALADFGAAWLGWDLARGQVTAHPVIPHLPRPIADITATPRKYGLHGTIKPPFFLANGRREDSLNDALAALCDAHAPVTLNGLKLSRIGSFIALTIDGDQTRLADLAGKAVRELDAFRAPPSESELARRRKSNLSPRQEELLAQWGYPYVMDEFRFHITLSGRLGNEAEATMSTLLPHITPLLPSPFILDSLSLVGEDEDGLFHEIQRHTLTG
ncbi:putative phosphonate metabolism protein [Shimia isoporae]|uniref:Putative phosphonate metabolism protein n=1 Tax=Shimia isoporae TaxID=647720 RepID=A0A4R1N330_9RHOB|nr:DUF1045 domain-containing protein [Shimia isoporae]TCL01107.1 putative phosphonate metabolism protein [Shimia isoporae]